MNNLQKNIYQELSEIIVSNFKKIEYSFGFGSFWQNYNQYNENSDIDFLIILKREPELRELKCFYNNLENIDKKYNVKCSAQIFIGDYYDLFKNYENILRILTIYNKPNKIIDIYNLNQYNIYHDINNIDVDIFDLFKEQFKKILRFYNRDFYKYKQEIDFYRYKELKYLLDAMKAYQLLNPENKYKLILKKFNIIFNNYNNYKNIDKFHNLLLEINNLIE